ncbi:hypothetical protein LINPERPRIM_LOCUS5483 [Linum perenne]
MKVVGKEKGDKSWDDGADPAGDFCDEDG